MGSLLKPVSNRGSGKPLPTAVCLQKGAEVVSKGNNPAAGEYLLTRYEARLKEKGMLEEGLPVMKKLEEVTDFLKLKAETGSIWSGKMPTDYQKYQKALGADAANVLNGAFVEDNVIVNYYYTVSDKSDLKRGYGVGEKNESPNPETSNALDHLFNAWLAENNMMSDNGVIYEISDDGTVKQELQNDGQIKKDNNGEPIAKRADAEKLRQSISDPTTGFGPYVKKHNGKVALNVIPPTLPTQEVAPERSAGAAGA